MQSGSVPNRKDLVTLSLAGVRGLGEAAVLLSISDSTEEARLKRQVAQATKMQAVGQLAGGVAHDFNNVLTAILGTCDLMLLRHTPGDSDYDDIQQIRANSNRAASLTRQLLAFSRQQTLRPEVLQLPDVVQDVSALLKRLIGEKVKLTVTHDRDLGAVRADPSQLEQVIVNLVVNARDAILSKGEIGGGRITLATRGVTAADVRAMRSVIMPQVDYTALVVEDTGTGISPDYLGKIFEPFFTTKEQGRGGQMGEPASASRPSTASSSSPAASSLPRAKWARGRSSRSICRSTTPHRKNWPPRRRGPSRWRSGPAADACCWLRMRTWSGPWPNAR